MSRKKRIPPATEQPEQMDESLARLKELQRDPVVWKAFLDEQCRLIIEGELHAKEWGDPCEGTVVRLESANMPTRDRPPQRYQSRTRARAATSTPAAPLSDP